MLSEEETNYQTYPAKKPASYNNGLPARNTLISAIVAQMHRCIVSYQPLYLLFYWIREMVHMKISMLDIVYEAENLRTTYIMGLE